MAFSASDVKELRERTGAGMLDCKKALVETDGNMDEAIKFLREKGLAAAQKKSSRIAAEGLVSTKISEDKQTSAIVEVNSETDFVAKNVDFQEFVKSVSQQAIITNANTVEDFLNDKWLLDNSKTVKEVLTEKVAVIGENLNIRRFSKFAQISGVVNTYTHGGGKIGVMIELEGSNHNVVSEAAKNIAMQIAAVNPKYISTQEVSQDFIASETEIIKQQIMNDEKNQGKPEQIIQKMIDGRLAKNLKEVCLLEQAYVKDSSLTITSYLDQVSKEAGSKVSVKRFVRFETGEGIEKKQENFAEEVAKQINNN